MNTSIVKSGETSFGDDFRFPFFIRFRTFRACKSCKSSGNTTEMRVMPKKPVSLKAKNLSVTHRGVEVEGTAAMKLASLLISHRDHLIAAARRLDASLKPGDIFLDDAGRVVIHSARIQSMAFEAVRIGATPGNPKGLGRLVKRTGGKIGSDIISSSELASLNTIHSPPTIRGGGDIHEANFVCQGHGSSPGPEDDSLDLFCGEWDEILDGETDINCFCGWGSG